MSRFEEAFEKVKVLVEQFAASEADYLSASYQESEVRTDFIDKFWIALGWDVRHKFQTNPREQEVKVEKNPDSSASNRKADYAFYFKPEYRSPVFLVEAKKPSRKLADYDTYFQIVRYGRGASTPVCILTDFEEFHVIDCRYEPSMTKSFPSAQIHAFKYKDYLDKEKFGYIYWLFSHEAIEQGKLKAFIKEMPKARGKGTAKLTPDELVPLDEKFLKKLEEYRLTLAKAFKKEDESLTAEELTEATQKVIDRLVFIRFLEDKNIESDYIVDQISSKKGAAWKGFLAWSKELDVKYNGIVFKPHHIDSSSFAAPNDDVFFKICAEISHRESKSLFSYVSVEMLGSIYEQFLGKVITATAKRADIEEKPEVRKAGGVYYTPQYIVEYIVKNTVGKILDDRRGTPRVPITEGDSPTPVTFGDGDGHARRAPTGLTPKEVSSLRFADIACGSGSFLIAVYDAVLHHVEQYYNTHPEEARKAKCIEIDKDVFALSLPQKRQILLDNIYGVDIDNQAVEVAQLSLFLKLLESESGPVAGQLTFERTKILPDLSKNILCGNSLVEYDITQMNVSPLFKGGDTEGGLSSEDEKRIKPFDYRSSFKDIMAKGGFDAIVGNPPYVTLGGKEDTVYPKNYVDYLKTHYLCAEYKPNFFTFFYQRGFHLLKLNGLVALIVPRTFLDNYYFAPIREYFYSNSAIVRVDKFDYEVFKDATIGGSAIGIFKKPVHSEHVTNNVEMAVHKSIELFATPSYSLSPQKEILTDDNKAFSFLDKKTKEVFNKIQSNKQKLEDVCSVNNGVNTGNAAEILLSRTNDTPNHRKILEGKDVNRYTINWGGWWVNYDPLLKKTLDPKKLKTRQGKVDFALRDSRIFDSPKIVIRQTSDRLIGCIDYNKFVSRHSTHCILIENSDYDLKFILAIFNSTLLNFYYQSLIPETGKAFAEVKAIYVKSLPIPTLDLTQPTERGQHDKMVSLVEQMLEAKKRLAAARTDSDKTQAQRKCEYLDNEIDKLVYELYGLSAEEVGIVEGV